MWPITKREAALHNNVKAINEIFVEFGKLMAPETHSRLEHQQRRISITAGCRIHAVCFCSFCWNASYGIIMVSLYAGLLPLRSFVKAAFVLESFILLLRSSVMGSFRLLSVYLTASWLSSYRLNLALVWFLLSLRSPLSFSLLRSITLSACQAVKVSHHCPGNSPSPSVASSACNHLHIMFAL